MNTAGSLTLTSDHYHSKQQNFSAGVSIPVYGYGMVSASVNAGQETIRSDADSVAQQTGIFAGSGGFHIRTGRHTQLNGAAVAGTADKNSNRLDSGTLGFIDIRNHAGFSTEQQSGGISTDNGPGTIASVAGTITGAGNNSGYAASTTYAAVSDGIITIRNQENQRQSLSELNRDTEHAANALSPVFNKEREQKRLQTVQLLGEISGQISDIGRNYGKIQAHKKAGQRAAGADNAQKAAAWKTLLNERDRRTEKGENPAVVTQQDVSRYIYQ